MDEMTLGRSVECLLASHARNPGFDPQNYITRGGGVACNHSMREVKAREFNVLVWPQSKFEASLGCM